MAQNTIINDIVHLPYREWVLLRPEAIAGDFTVRTVKEFYLDPTTGLNYGEITYSAGLAKIFDEAITNATDNYNRNPYLMDPIYIDISDKYFRIKNTGATIPFVKIYDNDLHREFYKPELAFGVFQSSSNYDDSVIRTSNGKNGVGIKLTNVFSTYFEVNIVNNGIKYHQVYQNNMDPNLTSEATFEQLTTPEPDSVEIISYPDFSKLHISGITEGNLYHLLFRSFSCVAFNRDIYINNQKFAGMTFNNYAATLAPIFLNCSDEDMTTKYEKYEFKNNEASSVIYVVPQKYHSQFSYVNGVYTADNGTHINKLLKDIRETIDIPNAKTTKAKAKAAKVKTQPTKRQTPTNFLLVFLNQTVGNPEFDGQNKNRLTSTVSTDFTEIGKQLKDSVILRNYMNGNASGRPKAASRTFYKKCQPANKAGTKESMKCTLFITEGDSATGMVNKGFKEIGHDYYGVYTLRGKVLNVRKATPEKVDANDIVSNLLHEIGLQRGITYTSKQGLRYGRIVMVKDADVDGDAIMGLVYNIFYTFFKPLVMLGLNSNEGPFFYEFTTPAFQIILPKVKGEKFSRKLEFTTEHEFNKTLKDCIAKNIVKDSDDATHYMKGLGAIADEDVKRYFADIDSHLIPITVHDEILLGVKQCKSIETTLDQLQKQLQHQQIDQMSQIQLSQDQQQIDQLFQHQQHQQIQPDQTFQHQFDHQLSQQMQQIQYSSDTSKIQTSGNPDPLQLQLQLQASQMISQNSLQHTLQPQIQKPTGEFSLFVQNQAQNSLQLQLPQYITVDGKVYELISQNFMDYLSDQPDVFKKYANIIYGPMKADNYMEMVYGKGSANIALRKNWVMKCDPKRVLERASGMVELPITLFHHLSSVHFALDDCNRSMVNIIDGCKPVYRKILYTLFSHPASAAKFQRVTTLGGQVTDFGKYMHGEASLQETIFTMMRNWAGSNNIALLRNRGGIGSRLDLGNAHAQPRYVETSIADITRQIYLKDDDPILTPTYEEGKKAEPEFYVPIIPMSLINGSCGIGVGFSNFIPNHNQYDCIKYIRATLSMPENVEKLIRFPNNLIPINPYYPECITNIMGLDNGKGYISYGSQEWMIPPNIKGDNFWECKLLPGKTGENPLDYNPAYLRVRALPIGINLYTVIEKLKEFINERNGVKVKKTKKTDEDSESEEFAGNDNADYEIKNVKKYCWPKVIDFNNNSTDGSNVQYEFVEVIFKIDNSSKLPTNFEVIPMKKELYTTNMYAIDEKGQIKYYNNVYEIINYYMQVRFRYYIKRKNFKLKALGDELIRTKNRMRFIKFKVEGLDANGLIRIENINEFGRFLRIEGDKFRLDSRGIKKNMLIKIMELFQFDKYDEKNKQYVRYDAEGQYTYITKSVNTHHETIEEYVKLQGDIDKINERYNELINTSIATLWNNDLDVLEKSLIEFDNELKEIKTSNIGKSAEKCGEVVRRRGRKK